MLLSASFGGDYSCAEIDIFGDKYGLAELGRHLVCREEYRTIILSGETRKFYPISLERIIITRNERHLEKVSLLLEGPDLHLTGTHDALSALGEGIIEFFSDCETENAHIHLDYLGGLGELGPTEHSLTITIR